ncbi:hypothetical protein AV274_2645 [Blastocystis sp. ATCC 50177/Nand II]|uniref:Uncharacterized protein n=1 Tax=Blastocystis sp. subtype 1 (strain ATCC 50177 / NandII) TaxID=478820 RepID=A0A196SHD1_BLAHN|nr:hypothetical protein AV274_2645 [Blastocystis sp. ATCC 50177/Nand II]
MSSNLTYKEEQKQKGERTNELLQTKAGLSKAQAQRILRTISDSVPKNTPESRLLDIIYTCDGNMDAIEQKIVGLWEGDNEDAWTPVISRAEKIKNKAIAEERERRERRRQNMSRRLNNRRDAPRNPAPQAAQAPPAPQEAAETPKAELPALPIHTASLPFVS